MKLFWNVLFGLSIACQSVQYMWIGQELLNIFLFEMARWNLVFMIFSCTTKWLRNVLWTDMKAFIRKRHPNALKVSEWNFVLHVCEFQFGVANVNKGFLMRSVRLVSRFFRHGSVTLKKLYGPVLSVFYIPRYFPPKFNSKPIPWSHTLKSEPFVLINHTSADLAVHLPFESGPKV